MVTGTEDYKAAMDRAQLPENQIVIPIHNFDMGNDDTDDEMPILEVENPAPDAAVGEAVAVAIEVAGEAQAGEVEAGVAQAGVVEAGEMAAGDVDLNNSDSDTIEYDSDHQLEFTFSDEY